MSYREEYEISSIVSRFPCFLIFLLSTDMASLCEHIITCPSPQLHPPRQPRPYLQLVAVCFRDQSHQKRGKDVGKIACLYWAIPFHNLEHSNHVALSAKKLMYRIIAKARLSMATIRLLSLLWLTMSRQWSLSSTWWSEHPKWPTQC